MLYFAYGSNMDFERMRQRSPNARFLFRAMLLGYELAFTRHLPARCGEGKGTQASSIATDHIARCCTPSRAAVQRGNTTLHTHRNTGVRNGCPQRNTRCVAGAVKAGAVEFVQLESPHPIGASR